jgi:hypothetical protein
VFNLILKPGWIGCTIANPTKWAMFVLLVKITFHHYHFRQLYYFQFHFFETSFMCDIVKKSRTIINKRIIIISLLFWVGLTSLSLALVPMVQKYIWAQCIVCNKGEGIPILYNYIGKIHKRSFNPILLAYKVSILAFILNHLPYHFA